MTGMVRSLTGCLCLGVLLNGCSLAPPRVGEPGPSLPSTAEENAYQSTLERYSDRAEVYDLLNARLFAAITYQSWPFRESRVRRMAIFQVQPPALVDKNLAAERLAFCSFHEFFFGVHLSHSRYDDFDRKDSIWRIALVTKSGETSPMSVERVGRSDLNMRAIYPYMDDFWVAYRIRFPLQTSSGQPVIPPGSQRFTLRMASTIGKAEFHFPAE
jgi:hypothetical protein